MRMRWMGAASASSTPGFWAGLIAVAIWAGKGGAVGEFWQAATAAEAAKPLRPAALSPAQRPLSDSTV